MNCEDVATLLHPYLDNELDFQASLKVEAHLEACEHCQAEMAAMTELGEVIRLGMDYHPAPEKLVSALQDIAGKSQEKKSWFFTRRQWQPVATFAALVLAVSIGYLLRPLPPSPMAAMAEEVVAEHIRSLMVAHLTDVASSDQHTVKPWFNGKLDYSPRVIDLAEQGFTLVGGRLDYLASRAVTALVYRRRQHLINVFIWPDNQLRLPAYADTRNGFNLLAFNVQGMNYWVVSDLNKAELQTLQAYLVLPGQKILENSESEAK